MDEVMIARGFLMNSIARLGLLVLIFLLFLSSCSRYGSGENGGNINFLHRSLDNDTIVIIDPGHGGKDKGTQGVGEKTYYEKNFTLVTARLLKSHLNNLGYRAILTRDSDRFVPLTKRVRMSNKIRNAILVSVHFNAAKSVEADGIEVFYHQSVSSERRMDSKSLAQSIQDSMVKITRADDRGIKPGSFHVLRKTVMPAVLVEAGFLSNPEELERLLEPKYLNAVAWGIAKGIDAYLN